MTFEEILIETKIKNNDFTALLIKLNSYLNKLGIADEQSGIVDMLNNRLSEENYNFPILGNMIKENEVYQINLEVFKNFINSIDMCIEQHEVGTSKQPQNTIIRG